MRTYLFPGQGAQKRGMGAGLFEHFPFYTKTADRILGYSIQSLCLEDKDHQLNQTQYTQPALFVVNALMYLKHLDEGGEKPDYFAGHSLGEYNALFAAGVFDFETGLSLVKKRGELMSQAQGGGMSAVLGLTREQLQALLDDKGLSRVSIANHNSYQQIVISGPKAEVSEAETIIASQDGVRCVPLNVSGAFHSPLMKEAQHNFSSFLDEQRFNLPQRPVIANFDAKPYHPKVIKSNLSQHLTHPVEWTQSMAYLLKKPAMEFKEMGPGQVLTQLLKRIQENN